MSSYERFDDPYCYPNSRVLKNRADIRSPESLATFEVRATTLRANDPLPNGKFVPAHYRAIHPFREGNGRMQLTFLFLLGERAGFALDMTRIRPQEMLSAMIASFDGKPGAWRKKWGSWLFETLRAEQLVKPGWADRFHDAMRRKKEGK